MTVKYPAGVSAPKLKKMKSLVEGLLAGDQIAKGVLTETLSTGDDSIFNFAYQVEQTVYPMFDKAPRTWTEIADVQTYEDFKTPVKYGLNIEAAGLSTNAEPGKPANVAPIVPELAPYPEFVFKGELSQDGELHKRGVSFGLSWERLISDITNIVPQLPGMITETFLDAEEWEVYSSLVRGGSGVLNQLKGGTNLDGTVGVNNGPVNRANLIQAVTQLSNRVIDGRKVQVSSFTLVVPQGMKAVADWAISTLSVQELTDGALKFNVNGYNPLSPITKVVETPFLTGTGWYLIPAKGSTRRTVLELAKLRGHESIEIRLRNATGVYTGGGAVAPFEGSFETDDIRFRGRYPITGLNWTPQLILFSKGDGSTPA
jgi:hypothetical protein